jgi:hypothetical protein
MLEEEGEREWQVAPFITRVPFPYVNISEQTEEVARGHRKMRYWRSGHCINSCKECCSDIFKYPYVTPGSSSSIFHTSTSAWLTGTMS